MSIIKNNKNYGTKVKIEEVHPSPFPEYLTVTYTVPEITNSFKILDNTNNIVGYRVKGATTWETPVTTIATTSVGTLELEFNLSDNTKISRYQFSMVFNVCKVDLPATVTTLEDGCFYNCRCLTEMPNLQNVTDLRGEVFSSTNIKVNKYVINDNVTRNYADFGSTQASAYAYVNGTLYKYLEGSMEGAVSVRNNPVDLSDGIDGLPIYKIKFHFRDYNISTVKLPATLTEIGELAFMSDNITNVYMYSTTPPTGGGFYDCNITNFYVPQGSLAAYQAAYPNYASIITEMP